MLKRTPFRKRCSLRRVAEDDLTRVAPATTEVDIARIEVLQRVVERRLHDRRAGDVDQLDHLTHENGIADSPLLLREAVVAAANDHVLEIREGIRGVRVVLGVLVRAELAVVAADLLRVRFQLRRHQQQTEIAEERQAVGGGHATGERLGRRDVRDGQRRGDEVGEGAGIGIRHELAAAGALARDRMICGAQLLPSPPT